MKKILILVLLTACKSSGFRGDDEQKPAASPSAAPAVQIPVNPSVSPVAPPVPCVDDGAIVAKNMTQKILNAKPNQIVLFELTVKDCFGKERVIQTNQIRFDYDALIYRTIPDSMPYRLKTRDQKILSSGTMDRTQGSDLFGNISAERFYWRTASDLKIPPATTLLYLEIDVSNLEFHLPQNKNPFPKIEQINMFLSFATATPVTTTINYEN